jgi:O-antigen ligase
VTLGTAERPAVDRPAGEVRAPLRPVGHWLFAGSLWTVFGIALSNVLLGLSVLASPWAARGARETWRRARPFLILLGLYVGLLLLAAAVSLDPGRSARSMAELFNLAVAPLALVYVRGEREARRVVDGLTVVAGGIAVTGLVQFLVGYDDLSHRILGPFSHYMTFSGVLLVADLVLAARLAAGPRSSGWRRAARWIAFAVINVALLASYTRSAWVGLGVALALLLLLRAPRWLLALPVAALLFALLAPAAVRDRVCSIVDLHDPSNRDRLAMARAGLAMVRDRPLVGLGPEMVEELYPRYRVETAVRDVVPHLHDTYLQLAAERGLPALAVYLALIGWPLRLAWRRFRAEGGWRGERGDLHLGVLLALVGFGVAGLFEHNWGDTEVQRQVLFLLALPFCLPPRETEDGVDAPGASV